MKRLLLGFLLGILCTSLLAEEGIPFSSIDGEFWRGLPEIARVAYVGGYLDAQDAHRIVMRRMAELSPPAAVSLEEFESANPALGRKALTQVLEGIDKLSSDYRNGKIHVVGLIRIVSMELAGRPPDEIDRALRQMREAFNK